jgi:Holliday junction resolvase RusA-like endonuclease
MRLVIVGPPRSKKNHSRIVRAGRRLRLIPSAAHERWAHSALRQLRLQWRRPPITTPVNVRATFFRERAVADAVNLYQALADALERAGVVANDRLIVSWDGSRLDKDAKHPRIEVELTQLDEEATSDQR